MRGPLAGRMCLRERNLVGSLFVSSYAAGSRPRSRQGPRDEVNCRWSAARCPSRGTRYDSRRTSMYPMIDGVRRRKVFRGRRLSELTLALTRCATRRPSRAALWDADLCLEGRFFPFWREVLVEPRCCGIDEQR